MPELHDLNSWDELAVAIREAELGDIARIYRGVTDYDSHKLLPKIGRKGARKDSHGKPLPYSREQEITLLGEFIRTARPFLNHEPQNDLEWLAIAQHWGAPTRLLDWTRSPLVATFFAMEKAGTDGRPAVYCVEPPPRASKKDPFDEDEVVTYYPPHITPRIQVQASVFTVHPEPSSGWEPDALEVWRFPKYKPCWEMKKIVDSCGFNRASLFPDLGGLAEYTGWCYKWGRFPAE